MIFLQIWIVFTQFKILILGGVSNLSPITNCFVGQDGLLIHDGAHVVEIATDAKITDQG